jgi:hypothetical protein
MFAGKRPINALDADVIFHTHALAAEAPRRTPLIAIGRAKSRSTGFFRRPYRCCDRAPHSEHET